MSDTRATAQVENDAHTEHCCYRHGCKYHWAGRRTSSCSVVSGEKPQSFMCERCADDVDEDWELILFINEMWDRGFAVGTALVTFK